MEKRSYALVVLTLDSKMGIIYGNLYLVKGSLKNIWAGVVQKSAVIVTTRSKYTVPIIENRTLH